MRRPTPAIDFVRFEGLLASRLTTCLGLVLLLPLFLHFLANGSLTFRVEPRSDREIQRILAPPQPRSAPALDFDQNLMPDRTSRLDFEAFSEERDRRGDLRAELLDSEQGQADAYLPAPSSSAAGADPQLRLQDAEEEASRDSGTRSEAALPSNDGLLDPSSLSDSATGGTGSAGPSLRSGAALSGVAPESRTRDGTDSAPVTPGVEGSERVVADPETGRRTPEIAARRTDLAPPEVTGPGGEKQDLIDWIAGHAESLPAAVAVALEEDPLKGDRTARLELTDASGRVHEIYLLHRHENDLVRLLVVRGDFAWRLDLPERRLAADHVQAGEVVRGDFGGGSPDRPRAPIVEVALRAVAQIPDAAREALELVRDALVSEGNRDGGR